MAKICDEHTAIRPSEPVPGRAATDAAAGRRGLRQHMLGPAGDRSLGPRQQDGRPELAKRAWGGAGRRKRRSRSAGWRESLAERLRAYFFAGLIVTAPIAITLLIVWQVVSYFDTTLGAIIPQRYNPETYLPFSLPGIGLLMMLGFVMLAGWFTAGLVGRTVMRVGEHLLDRTPVVRAIYGTLKQVFETLFQQSSRAFREVVLVEFPRPGSWALGFVTGSAAGGDIPQAEGEELASVLIPMSPFPSSGFLIFVPSSELVHLDMTVDEGMKTIISGGIVGTPAVREAVVRQAASPRAPELARR